MVALLEMKPFISRKIEIKSTRSSGRGVFVTSSIKKGEIIEISPLIVTPSFDYTKLNKTIMAYYWYEFAKRACAIGLGYASLYNHSDDNNAEFSIIKKSNLIKIKATREIKKGEEILINYGYDVKKHNLSLFFAKKKV